ncbi:hypothetical protein CYY_008880 [Polysphondylium violaceum]|uniref:NmrA-like domain-containing protein n=1 Tax=Polysphondylium violaceum TaxID=133409 RepID=A0A8J4PMG1_9MYCE|nr:hypothetical protein CYY_008880 [Polysphondylium violaceum]
MNNKTQPPIFVVPQVFSKQGKSIVNAILRDGGKYQIIGLTSRDVQKTAQADLLEKRGVKVVQVDLSDKDKLVEIYKGAYGVFIVKPVISPFDPEFKEKSFDLIKTQADACLEANVQQVIFSATDGELDSNGKTRDQRYIEGLSIPFVTTFFLGFFYSNVIEFYRPKVEYIDDSQSPTIVFSQPFDDTTAVPYVDSYTATGQVVSSILANPHQYNRHSLKVVSEYLTGPQFAEIFQQSTGIKSRYQTIDCQQYLIDNGFHASPEYQFIGTALYNTWLQSVINTHRFKDQTNEYHCTPLLNLNQFLLSTKWNGIDSFDNFKLNNQYI